MGRPAERIRPLDDIAAYMGAVGAEARAASAALARASTADKNDALGAIATAIESSAAALTEANRRDLDAARDWAASPITRKK